MRAQGAHVTGGVITRLFLYGTLKRGCSNHPYMAGQRFIDVARTVPLYRLVSMGTYPGMVLAEEGAGRSIEGEVWDVDEDCLRRLDVLEGIQEGEYAYEVVPLMPPFDAEAVHGYRYLRPVEGRPDIGAAWRE